VGSAGRLAGQAVFYLVLMGLVGLFATWPAYTQFPPDAAQIKLSFAHGAGKVVACRRLTSEEIARLPPKDRRPDDCERQRRPIEVELLLDGKPLYRARLEATGIAGDGPARAYEKFQVPVGSHEVTARLRDSDRTEGFDYEKQLSVELVPGQNLAIDFRADRGGFLVH
jgi:hypothetical protein